jgi:hypothetical protein
MEDIIQQLKNAIVTIDNKYFQRKERDFSYEIYHQMRRYEYQFNVEVSSESVKNRFSLDDEILQDKLIRSCFFNVNQDINRNIIRFPDLIFHEYDTLNHQELAIEIKKIFNPELITRDIAKLAVYCYGRLKYKKGIFILVNPNPRRNVLEVPNVRELLERFPEIEIWIARPSQEIEVICSKTI